jgi:LacI family transcriptional regulator
VHVGGADSGHPMERLPTIEDVARLAGVHHSTVSRALRKSPSIPATTRERIEAVAREIGYRPDPLLSALANRKQTGESPAYRATLAWLTNYPTARGWVGGIHSEGYYRGAKARAEQLGFLLDEIWVRERGQTPDALSRILTARGIRGILVPPQPTPHCHLNLQWPGFCAVTFGTTLSRPHLHSVAHDHYRSVAKLVRHLVAMGFCKPVFFFEQEINLRVDGCWAAGFRFGMEKCGLPHGNALRPVKSQDDAGRLVEYLRKDRPDVMLINVSLWKTLQPLVAKAGIKIPKDISVAVVTVPDANTELGGISENAGLMGAMAVDLLSGFLQRGDYGLPRRPFRMTVEGEYLPGKTIQSPVPPKKAKVKAKAR